MFSVAGSLLIIFIQPHEVSQVAYAAFVLTAKFGVSATFNMVFIVTPDYFPPSIRGQVFGFINLFSRVFTFFSPQIAEIQAPWPMVLFGLAAVFASFSTLFLKDVKKKELGLVA